MRQSWETMTSVSAGHIIQTPTQPVGSGRPQRESNPGPPHQESRALPQSYRAPHGKEERMKAEGRKHKMKWNYRKVNRMRNKVKQSVKEKEGEGDKRR